MDWLDDDLRRREEAGLRRVRRAIQSGQGVEVRWRDAERVNFSSNDYLGYAADSRLCRAAARAALKWGSGAGASPLVSGFLPPLRALERDLAAWEGTEDALVFSSGFSCNIGVITALASRDAVLFSDELNHASLIDGCRLSKAPTHVYRHADLGHLEELLRAHQARRRIIVSDSVFSMDGDTAPLDGLLRLAREQDALLVLDEAHATGVLGNWGRGLADGITDARLVKVGTLSKALASQGGFVCGSSVLIDFLVNNARSYIFSTALAPACAAAARRAISLVAQEPERRQQLLSLAAFLRRQLAEAGFDTGGSSTHLVPLILGSPQDAVEASEMLEARGFLVPAIRPPSVPAGTSRLRISLSAAHTEEDAARLVAALRR